MKTQAEQQRGDRVGAARLHPPPGVELQPILRVLRPGGGRWAGAPGNQRTCRAEAAGLQLECRGELGGPQVVLVPVILGLPGK